MNALKRLTRPEYGDSFKITPKRWWSRKDRKSAKLAAKVADFHSDEISALAIRQSVDGIIYGSGFTRQQWMPPER